MWVRVSRRRLCWEKEHCCPTRSCRRAATMRRRRGRSPARAIEKARISDADISTTVATGYGAAAVDFADRTVADISCHAAGIYHLFPSVRTVVDIGSQFCRAIKLDDDGRVTNFVQNEKCAGGSGKFLQVIARILHMNVEDIGALSLQSTNPVEFTTGCAVFAESEAVSRIAEGASPADILAGVHKAMSAKIVNLTIRLGLVRGLRRHRRRRQGHRSRADIGSGAGREGAGSGRAMDNGRSRRRASGLLILTWTST